MVPRLDDLRVRMGAFAWLAAQVSAQGEVLPWSPLPHGGEEQAAC